MLDKNGILVSLLQSMRQKATQDFICLLESIAGELEVESEPLETMQEDSIMVEFDAVWFDR